MTMARLGVTREDVFQACEALVSTGVPVTVANVRHELGTGSYTTLLPLIQAFKGRDLAERSDGATASAPVLPDTLNRQGLDLMTQIWAHASDLAKKEIEAAKAEFTEILRAKDQELENVSTELSQTLSDLKRYESELSQLRHELDSEKAARQKQEGEMGLLRSQVATREGENKALLERAIGAEKEIEKVRVEFTAALSAKEKELGQLTSEYSQARSHLQKQEQEVSALRAEFDTENAKWQKKQGEVDLLRSQVAAKELENRAFLERAIRAEKDLELKTKSTRTGS